MAVETPQTASAKNGQTRIKINPVKLALLTGFLHHVQTTAPHVFFYRFAANCTDMAVAPRFICQLPANHMAEQDTDMANRNG